MRDQVARFDALLLETIAHPCVGMEAGAADNGQPKYQKLQYTAACHCAAPALRG
jgi:hypothetical protein